MQILQRSQEELADVHLVRCKEDHQAADKDFDDFNHHKLYH